MQIKKEKTQVNKGDLNWFRRKLLQGWLYYIFGGGGGLLQVLVDFGVWDCMLRMLLPFLPVIGDFATLSWAGAFPLLFLVGTVGDCCKGASAIGFLWRFTYVLILLHGALLLFFSLGTHSHIPEKLRKQKQNITECLYIQDPPPRFPISLSLSACVFLSLTLSLSLILSC